MVPQCLIGPTFISVIIGVVSERLMTDAPLLDLNLILITNQTGARDPFTAHIVTYDASMS